MIDSPKYWETIEYKADQEAFDGGKLTPHELWLMALQWGVESKVASWVGKKMSREIYLKKCVSNHKTVWEIRESLPTPLEDLLVGKVLDVGCGVATFLEIMSNVREAVAVDPCFNDYVERLPHFASPGQVGKCRYINGVIQDIREEDFDVVYSFNAIDHGIDWEDILANCARVLLPRGILLLGVHVCHSPRTGYHRRLTHPSHFSSESLWNRLEEVGFEIVYKNQQTTTYNSWLSLSWSKLKEK